MERTLSIIKPDGVKKNITGEIIRRFETAGLRVAAIKKAHMTKAVAEGFYAVHKGKFFYDELTDFMSEGPVVLMVLEGNDAIALNRKLMGATNFKEADPGTIRADFATSIQFNVVHGSDAPDTAKFEISYFFAETEIF
jgi:nucleoside-diphosphate kinase